jgi:hypothetical protein
MAADRKEDCDRDDPIRVNGGRSRTRKPPTITMFTTVMTAVVPLRSLVRTSQC